jgi:hypothetical protein
VHNALQNLTLKVRSDRVTERCTGKISGNLSHIERSVISFTDEAGEESGWILGLALLFGTQADPPISTESIESLERCIPEADLMQLNENRRIESATSGIVEKFS